MSSSAPLPARSARIPGLDLLRGLAVLLVLGNHTWMWSPPSTWPRALAVCFESWQRGGWVGVDLFFVLSGFLVSGLLFNEYQTHGTIHLGGFYLRRGWKIYPPFYVFIGATLAAHLLLRRPIPDGVVLPELLFMQNYLPGLWGHTWSLAVEEHFYVLLPLLLCVLIRIGRGRDDPFARRLPMLVFALAATILVLRWENASRHAAYGHRTHLYYTHLRLDGLLIGVLLAYWQRYHSVWFALVRDRWGGWLACGGALLLTPPFFLNREECLWLSTIGLTTNALGAAGVLMGLLPIRPTRSSWLAGLAAVGRHSYSIYLWHMPVMLWAIPQFEALLGSELSYLMRVGLSLSGSMTVGIVMAFLVEVPALRLRHRWSPGRAG